MVVKPGFMEVDSGFPKKKEVFPPVTGHIFGCRGRSVLRLFTDRTAKVDFWKVPSKSSKRRP